MEVRDFTKQKPNKMILTLDFDSINKNTTEQYKKDMQEESEKAQQEHPDEKYHKAYFQFMTASLETGQIGAISGVAVIPESISVESYLWASASQRNHVLCGGVVIPEGGEPIFYQMPKDLSHLKFQEVTEEEVQALMDGDGSHHIVKLNTQKNQQAEDAVSAAMARMLAKKGIGSA